MLNYVVNFHVCEGAEPAVNAIINTRALGMGEVQYEAPFVSRVLFWDCAEATDVYIRVEVRV